MISLREYTALDRSSRTRIACDLMLGEVELRFI
jgi:hypothetical protein